MARILVTIFGSLGDLFPYLSVGDELKARGHQLRFCAPEVYREKVTSKGYEFVAIPPHFNDKAEFEEIIKHVFHPTKGSEYLFTKVLMPHIAQAYEETLAAARDVDLIVSHPATYATPLVAQKLGKPWISTMLQPILFWSLEDPSVLRADMENVREWPRFVRKMVLWMARHGSARWCKELFDLRQREGFPKGGHPVMDDAHSPYMGLALFSEHFAKPQSDWPANYHVCGFPFYDQPFQPTPAYQASMEKLERFLAAGEPPVVFTLGSSAVMNAGDFYRQSSEACKILKRRAVLLTGPNPEAIPANLPADQIAVEYAPHGMVFARGAAVVHQGGIGTLSQAMRAGKPMIVVPHSQDQPDNAVRACLLGVSRRIPALKYSTERAVKELRPLLEDPAYARKATEIGAAILRENGPKTAADHIEAFLARTLATSPTHASARLES